jgi:hypothetical protein
VTCLSARQLRECTWECTGCGRDLTFTDNLTCARHAHHPQPASQCPCWIGSTVILVLWHVGNEWQPEGDHVSAWPRAVSVLLGQGASINQVGCTHPQLATQKRPVTSSNTLKAISPCTHDGVLPGMWWTRQMIPVWQVSQSYRCLWFLPLPSGGSHEAGPHPMTGSSFLLHGPFFKKLILLLLC